MSNLRYEREIIPDDPYSLMHFKYIKRYRENGKWRYIYPGSKVVKDIKETGEAIGDKVKDAIGVDEKKHVEDTKRWENNAKEQVEKAKREYDSSLENLHNTTSDVLKDNSAANKIKVYGARDELADTSSRLSNAEKNYSEKKDQAERAKSAYDKTILGVSERVVNKGKKFLEKLKNRR